MDLNFSKLKLKLKPKKNYRKEKLKVNSDLYWESIVVSAFLLLVVSVVFSFNLFLETNKADNQVIVNNNDQTGNKEKAKIEDALQYFSERATKSTEILNSTASVVDPAQ
jgi:capsular polysaccharide biosynthesis protein